MLVLLKVKDLSLFVKDNARVLLLSLRGEGLLPILLLEVRLKRTFLRIYKAIASLVIGSKSIFQFRLFSWVIEPIKEVWTLLFVWSWSSRLLDLLLKLIGLDSVRAAIILLRFIWTIQWSHLICLSVTFPTLLQKYSSFAIKRVIQDFYVPFFRRLLWNNLLLLFFAKELLCFNLHINAQLLRKGLISRGDFVEKIMRLCALFKYEPWLDLALLSYLDHSLFNIQELRVSWSRLRQLDFQTHGPITFSSVSDYPSFLYCVTRFCCDRTLWNLFL